MSDALTLTAGIIIGAFILFCAICIAANVLDRRSERKRFRDEHRRLGIGGGERHDWHPGDTL